MQIILNGEPSEVPEGICVADLLAFMKIDNKRLAVEINEELVPRSTFPAHRLATADQVEIVHAIGGG